MQCLSHVMKILLVGFILLFPNYVKSTEAIVDENFCHGLALVAHATAEANQRKEPINKWQRNLLTLKGYDVKGSDNVLYKILPRAIQNVHDIYERNDSPKEAYIGSFDSCMSEDYGNLVVIR